MGIEQRHAGQGQRHQTQGKGDVCKAPGCAKALDVFALEPGGHAIELDMRLASTRFALLVFPVEPEQGMQPEEAKGANQQLRHDLPGNPNLWVMSKIIGLTVRLVADKAGRHVRQAFLGVVAGLAGLEPVGRVHQGFGVADWQNFVAAMAVVALGGVVIAQRTDLAVEGVFVALQFVNVAIATV
ncbi:hypothetical protein GALL_432690 [mine drainage metagenome]|uniref:Uncharacterized protein n=1 Tax=mine drainage metagenome TaxID=410659 RepID=A0A1J5QGH5_9ZZZZ